MKKYSVFIALLILSLLLASCSQAGTGTLETNIKPEDMPESQPTEKETESIEPDLTKDDDSTSIEDKSSAIIMHENIVIFPEPNGLVEVEIQTDGKALPESKKDGELPVILSFTAGGASLTAYGEIKVQGSSTAKWPKKNWSLSFYQDEELTEKLRLQLGDSIATDKWITKAEWIDPTMLRNALSYRLWEGMVKSRNTFPQYEVDNVWLGEDNMAKGVQTGAQGFPKTYPAQIKVNGEHYGISILTLGHDPRNFNIDPDNKRHMYLEFDARGGYTTEKTWEKFSDDGIGEWIDGYYPANEDMKITHKIAIRKLGQLINGSQSYFEENFEQHLDKTNMIDMLLFLEVIYDWDAVAQDIEMVTYDLKKWYMLPWDKDTTFGMSWDESGLKANCATKLLIDYETEKNNQKPWFKTYHAFKPEVEARYAQLRDCDIFTVHNLYRLTGEITKKIPPEMWQAEKLRWQADGRPSLDETSTAQILTWFETRLEMLDQHFKYKAK